MTTEQYVGWIIAVAVFTAGGYIIGGNHAKTEQELKARLTRPVLPCKCVGLKEQDIRNAVYRACKRT